MTKTVFVHIGANAAGGSFLQTQLDKHRATLRDAGIAVIDSLRRDLVRGPGVDCRTVVFSNPRLAGAPARRAARVLGMLGDHHVHLIYGMPNVGDALVAEWQRHIVANDQDIALAAWIKELAAGEHPSFWRTYDLTDVVGRWAVPPGNVHVVVAPSGSGRVGELWTRFASVIGAPPIATAELSPIEEPLGPEGLELLRRVHARMAQRRAATGAHELVTQTLTERQVVRDPWWPRLPPDHRSWIESQAAAQRAHLESSGFEIAGELVDLELDDRRFAPNASLPSESRVLASAVEASAVLVERLVRCREQQPPPQPRDSAGHASPTRIRGILERTRGVVSGLRAAAPGVIRHPGRTSSVNGGRRTYYLHIGAPKSGSSYLQSLLWKNRHALMHDGVYVPGRSQTDHFWAGTDFRQRGYVTQAPDDPWRGAWDRLIDDAERSGCPRIVISSEFLADSPAKQISAALERLSEADVHVIYAVRELSGLLGSVWQQGVRVGPVAPWREWLDAMTQPNGPKRMWLRHDVGRVCARWAAKGVDEMHVLVLPRPGSARDELWQRFQSIVGWSVRTSVDTHRANESLGYSQAEFLRRLQHRLVGVEPRHQRARITKNLIASQVLAKMERVDALVIPEHLREWLETESVKRRDQVVASRAHIVGDVDDLLLAGSKLSLDPPDPSEAVMVSAAVNVIERLAATVLREEAWGKPAPPSKGRGAVRRQPAGGSPSAPTGS